MSESSSTGRGRGCLWRAVKCVVLVFIVMALALTSLVLITISVAIDFHLRVVNRGRAHVEEALIARALLHLIADDLRNAVAYDAGEDTASGGSQMATTGTSVVPQTVPGVYGEIDWLQVDVSRVPRLDQYDYEVTTVPDTGADSQLVDVLSDVKTVAYCVVDPGELGSSYTADGEECSGGLIRREMDRAVTIWASEQGQLEEMELDLEPIAPEVLAIEFLYYDGSEWLEYWDSEEQGGLPVAVEISLVIMPPDRDDDEYSAYGYDSLADYEDYPIYRLLVHLPAATAGSSEGGP